MSVFTGELNAEIVIKEVKKITNAFPALPKGFFEILSQRIKALNFSDERLIQSVNHVIDNCVYPTPTIANFISFDRRIKFYTYDQMSRLVDQWGSLIWNQYESLKIEDITVWATKIDLKSINYKKT